MICFEVSERILGRRRGGKGVPASKSQEDKDDRDLTSGAGEGDREREERPADDVARGRRRISQGRNKMQKD